MYIQGYTGGVYIDRSETPKGLLETSKGLLETSKGLQETSKGLQETSKGLQDPLNEALGPVK